MNIILASLPPSYEAVMNALTTSLEECGMLLEPDSIIRILKAQYDKKKTQSTNVEEAFVGTSKKKVTICTNCKKKGIQSRSAGIKVVEKKAKVLNKRNASKPRSKKRRPK